MQKHCKHWRKKNNTKIQARKKSLGPETARWGGGLPRKGVVAKKFVPSLKSLSSLGFEERNLGCPGNFAGMSRTPGGAQKVCAKKVRAHVSFPKDDFFLDLVAPSTGWMLSYLCFTPLTKFSHSRFFLSLSLSLSISLFLFLFLACAQQSLYMVISRNYLP